METTSIHQGLRELGGEFHTKDQMEISAQQSPFTGISQSADEYISIFLDFPGVGERRRG